MARPPEPGAAAGGGRWCESRHGQGCTRSHVVCMRKRLGCRMSSISHICTLSLSPRDVPEMDCYGCCPCFHMSVGETSKGGHLHPKEHAMCECASAPLPHALALSPEPCPGVKRASPCKWKASNVYSPASAVSSAELRRAAEALHTCQAPVVPPNMFTL